MNYFFGQLKKDKACLTADWWSPLVRLYRYKVQKWQG